MLTTITLSAQDCLTVDKRADGKVVVTLPQAVLIQAYCDYVAAKAQRPVARREEGTVQ